MSTEAALARCQELAEERLRLIATRNDEVKSLRAELAQLRAERVGERAVVEKAQAWVKLRRMRYVEDDEGLDPAWEEDAAVIALDAAIDALAATAADPGKGGERRADYRVARGALRDQPGYPVDTGTAPASNRAGEE